jgi:hypothetical protein
MKKSLFISALLILSVIFSTQGQSKQNEVGVVFSNVNSFGLTFKTGTEKGLWRFTALSLSGNSQKNDADSSTTKNHGNGFGVKFGYEFRKTVVGNLQFRYGADLTFNFNHSKIELDDKSISQYSTTVETTTYSPGINFVLGFNYVFLNKFVVGIEALPYVAFTTGTSTDKSSTFNYTYPTQKTKTTGINYGLSNTSIMISVVYRFGGKK